LPGSGLRLSQYTADALEDCPVFEPMGSISREQSQDISVLSYSATPA
jgi:hypothetical protein